jgi:hypothetical protein
VDEHKRKSSIIKQNNFPANLPGNSTELFQALLDSPLGELYKAWNLAEKTCSKLSIVDPIYQDIKDQQELIFEAIKLFLGDNATVLAFLNIKSKI